MIRDCAVIGGGLAGAAVAASMARGGWNVTVLDAAADPASGASALPVGLLAPHYSADDNLLSRLTRAGVHLTLQEARARLREGIDWSPTGVQRHRAGASSLWHENAAWIRPSSLVRSWLGDPGVLWRGGCHAARLRREDDRWQVLGADGTLMVSAALLVIAAAHASASLLGGRIALHPVRGQVSWGRQDASMDFPPHPVNGNGHFIPGVPHADGLAWYSGSTYHHGDADPLPRDADNAANFERLRMLLPAVAQQLAPLFDRGEVRGWSGVRCASGDRRPIVGEVEPGLWVSTAMGSRGLTFSPLCAELIAARVNDEPPLLEPHLASALDLERFQ